MDQQKALQFNKVTMATSSTLYRRTTHTVDVMERLYQLYRAGQDTDVVARGLDGSISCHSHVLMGNCYELRMLLHSQTPEGGARELQFPTVSVATIKSLVEFMYTGELSITADSAKSILQLADQLQIKDVVTAVSEFMQTQVNPSNCIGFLRYSREHHLPKLEKIAYREILDRFPDVCQYIEFLTLTADELQSFLRDDDLDVSPEDIIYEAVMMWVKQSPQTRSSLDLLFEVIKYVRLPFCTSKFLKEVVSKDKLMQNYECNNLIHDARTYHMNPDKAHELIDSPQIVPRKAALSNGRLLLFGGAVDGHYIPSRGCYKLDTLTNKWEQFTEVPTDDHGRGSACYVNEGIFICGGAKPNNIAACWFYDIKASKWDKKADLLTPRCAHSAVAMDGDVFVIGGYKAKWLDDVERYSFTKNSWHTLAKLKLPTALFSALAHGAHIYVFGGTTIKDKYTHQCQRLDVTSMTWTYISDLPKAVAGPAAVVLDDDVFLVGGQPSVCYCYSTDTDQFNVLTPPGHVHRFGTGFIHNRKIVLLGGATKDWETPTSVCEVYSVKQNEWKEWLPNLPVTLKDHKAFYVS